MCEKNPIANRLRVFVFRFMFVLVDAFFVVVVVLTFPSLSPSECALFVMCFLCNSKFAEMRHKLRRKHTNNDIV